MKIIYDKHISKRTPPENLKDGDLKLFSHEFSKEIRETHLLELRDVLILNDIVVSMNKGRIYFDYTHAHKGKLKSLIKSVCMIVTKGVEINGGVWIIDNWSQSYFHWMTDALPRLLLSN